MKRVRNSEQRRIHGNFGRHPACFRERKPYSFFKLMLSPSQSKKLRIPEEFSRTFRHEFSTTVILKLPTGETRKVAITEEDNQLWLCDGWQQLVEDFSIDFAYFLLFTYEGNSNFTLHIFDLTACEISYQCSNARGTSQVQRKPHQCGNSHDTSQLQDEPCHEEVDVNVDDDGDSSSLEILGSPSVSRDNSNVEVIQLDSEDDHYVSDDDGEENVARTGGDAPGYPVWLRKYEGLMEAVTAAGINMPENPFFVGPIKAYTLKKGMYLYVPVHFARDHLRCKEMESKPIKLEVYGGRQWTVQCVRNHAKCTLSKGWIVFARDVGLEERDVCVFELTDAKRCILKVQVAKKSQIQGAGVLVF